MWSLFLSYLSRSVSDCYVQITNGTWILPPGNAWKREWTHVATRVWQRPEVPILIVIILLTVLYYQLTHSWLRRFFYECKLFVYIVLGWEWGPEDEEVIASRQRSASWDIRRDNVGVYAIQGRRAHMEDRFNVVENFEDTGTSIFGVFDGHGGEFAADFVEKTLFKSVMIRLLKSEVDHEQVDREALLREEILSVDRQLLNVARTTNIVAGTTCLMALVSNHHLTVANVGDSRGILCCKGGKVIPLSFDHKPQLVKERKRIKKAGGFISFNGVWRVAGVLATSRALGDLPLKDRNLVIADPDVLTFDLESLDPRPSFMVLATDGLWDAFSNDEVAQFVTAHLDEPHYGAKSLTLAAYTRGSMDNITVMVVKLGGLPGGLGETLTTQKVPHRVDSNGYIAKTIIEQQQQQLQQQALEVPDDINEDQRSLNDDDDDDVENDGGNHDDDDEDDADDTKENEE